MEIRPRASRNFRTSDDDKRQESFMTTVNKSNKNFTSREITHKNSVFNKQRNTIEDRSEAGSSVTSSPSRTIFHKVTDSFSGLFSNASWSEWIKSPLASSFKEEEEEESSYRGEMPDISAASSSSSDRSQSFKELYPEEGTADNMSPGEPSFSSPNTAEPSTDKPFIPIHTDLSSFKRGLPIISSTPFSPSSVRKKAPDDFLCESVITKASTSKLSTEILTPKEDAAYSSLARKSHIDTEAEHYPHSNGTFTRPPTARKRFRENGEEECVGNGNDYSRGSKRGRLAPSPLQMFSEGASEEDHEQIQQRKRPRFSISAFGSPLYNQTSSAQEEEETPQPFSIFYPGRIAFGGVSNHRKRKLRMVPKKILPRTLVPPTPNCDDGLDEGLSSVARRILHSIDKISTPLSASKRALPFTSPRNTTLDTAGFIADFHKHRPTLKVETTAPPVNKLLTPSKVKIRKNISSILEPRDVERFTSKSQVYDRSVLGRKSRLETPTASASTFTSSVQAFKMDLAQLPSQSTSKSFVVETRVSPLLSKMGKRFEPKGNTSSRPRNSVESTSHPISEHNLNSAEKMKKGVSSPLNTAAESSSRLPVKDESELYQFCEPEVVSSFPSQEPLFLTKIPDQTEFEFSAPVDETVKSANSVNEGISVGDSCPWGDRFKPVKGNWDCDVCLLQNEGAKTTCVACQSAKPSNSSSTSTATSAENSQPTTEVLGTLGAQSHIAIWGEAFKAPEGSWDCGSCLLQNKAETLSCIACMTPKPQKKSDIRSIPTSQRDNLPSSSWGDLFNPASGSWECEVCLLQNEEIATKCPSCETPKPSSRKQQATTSSVLHPKESSSSAPISHEIPQSDVSVNPFAGCHRDRQSHDGSVNCWGDTFKPSKGSWECAVCLLQNDEKASSCVACMSAKPKGPSSSDAKANLKEPPKGRFSPFEGNLSKEDRSGRFAQDVFKASDDSWVCSECILTNQSSEEKCVGCKGSRPDITNDSISSSRTQPSASLKSYVPKISRNDGSWSCDTCLAWNKVLLQKCANCQAPKVPLSPATVSEALTGSFKFGVKSQPAKETPRHSVAPPISSVPSRTSFSFVSPTLSMSKGSTAEMNTASPSGESPFVWNTSPTATPSIFGNTATFPFKAPSKPESSEKKDDSSNPVEKPLFQFSSVASSSSTVKGQETAPSVTLPKLEFPKPSEIKTSSTTAFSFSSKEPSKSAPKSTALPNPPPKFFNFFGGDKKTPSFTPFGPPNFAAGTTKTEDTAATTTTTTITSSTTPSTVTSTTTTAAATGASKPPTGVNFAFASTPSSNLNFAFASTPSSSNLNFAFGQTNSKPLNTGFNFGEAGPKQAATSFNFGGSPTSLFQFGQSQSKNSASAKSTEPAPPSFLNIEVAKTNPFNMATPGGGPQRRPFKKAFRRNK